MPPLQNFSFAKDVFPSCEGAFANILFLSLADSIGCITTPKDFCVAGTASEKLFGVAEGLWEPDLVRPSQRSNH